MFHQRGGRCKVEEDEALQRRKWTGANGSRSKKGAKGIKRPFPLSRRTQDEVAMVKRTPRRRTMTLCFSFVSSSPCSDGEEDTKEKNNDIVLFFCLLFTM